jgi:hypothetical protein
MTPDKKSGTERSERPAGEPSRGPMPSRPNQDQERPQHERTSESPEDSDVEDHDVERSRPAGLPEIERDPSKRLPQYTDVPKPEVQDG